MDRALIKWVVPALVAAVAALSHAWAQTATWQVHKADDGTFLATMPIDHPTTTGAIILTSLNIGFGRKNGCQPELGVAMLKGTGFGSPVGRVSPPRTEPITLLVDRSHVSTPAPFLMKYDNGLEVVLPVPQDTLETLAAGKTATVQIVTGTPRLEFPLAGIRAAMTEALRQCKATR